MEGPAVDDSGELESQLNLVCVAVLPYKYAIWLEVVVILVLFAFVREQ